MTQPDEEPLTVDDQVVDARVVEVSEADAAEQALTANSTLLRPGVPTMAFEANEYDAIEQDRVVEFDDDYR